MNARTLFATGLAPVLLSARKITCSLSGPRTGFRVVLLHDVPIDRRPSLSRLAARVVQSPGVVAPSAVAAWLEAPVHHRVPSEGPAPGQPILFSFDDGYISSARAAMDILEPSGIRALFFVCPGLIELSGDEQRREIARCVFDGALSSTDLKDHHRMMSWEDARELRRRGHVIGCHGMTHARLSSITGEALHAEVLGAADLFKKRMGEDAEWYAYAFGDIASVSAEALDLISRRFRFCRSGVRGWNGNATSPFALRAESLDLADPGLYHRLVLDGGLDFRHGAARRTLDAIAVQVNRDPGVAI